MARPRITGFGRFLLFLLLAGPLIYFGVAYFKGEDPVGQLKDMTGTDRVEEVNEEPMDCEALRAENARLRAEVAQLRGE